MRSFIGVVAVLSRVTGVFAALLIVAAVLVVCHMVFVRSLLGWNTIWQTEFTTYALVAATLIGSPYVLLTHGHVNCDIVPIIARGPARRRLAYAADALGLVFVGFLAVHGWEFWWEAWSGNWYSDTVWRVPLWIPYLSLPLGMTLLALQYVARMLAVFTGADEPFGMKADMPTIIAGAEHPAVPHGEARP